MRIRSFVTAAVLVALGTALIAPAAWAAENPANPTTPHVNFQNAIAHAVERESSRHRADAVSSSRANQPAMQRGYGGGGGGHMMMVVSMVGMVAGLGMTYYMIKQMQKTTGEASQPAMRGEK